MSTDVSTYDASGDASCSASTTQGSVGKVRDEKPTDTKKEKKWSSASDVALQKTRADPERQRSSPGGGNKSGARAASGCAVCCGCSAVIMGVVAVLCLVAVAAAVMALVLISHCEFGEAPDLEFTQTFEMPSGDALTIAPSTGSPPFPISSVVVRFDDAVTGITVDWEVWVDLDDDDDEDDEHDEHDGGHNDHGSRDSQTKSPTFEMTGSTLRVQDPPGDRWDALFECNRAQITITMPSPANASLAMPDWENGRIELSSVAAAPAALKSLSVSTSNGEVIATNLAVTEALDLESTNGQVTVEDLSALTVVLATSNGAIELTRVQADSVTASTTNGAVEVDQVSFGGPTACHLELGTTNGAVTGSAQATMTTVPDCALTADTTNGEISLEIGTNGGSCHDLAGTFSLSTTNGQSAGEARGSAMVAGSVVNGGGGDTFSASSTNGQVELLFGDCL